MRGLDASIRQAVQALHLTAGALERVIDVVMHYYLPECTDGGPHSAKCKKGLDDQGDKNFRHMIQTCKPQIIETPSATDSDNDTDKESDSVDEGKHSGGNTVQAIKEPVQPPKRQTVDESERQNDIGSESMFVPSMTLTPDEITPRKAAKRTYSELEDAVTSMPFVQRRRFRPLRMKEDAKLEAETRQMVLDEND